MSRGPRTLTEKGCYHVVQKGAGGQQIFEDAEDRLYYLIYSTGRFNATTCASWHGV